MISIGILGCGRIGPPALIGPAQILADVIRVAAVASRSHSKAADFARRHKIARAYGSYAELIKDKELDAIYNALPNSLHAEWSIQALEAGKHVLCEKPLACNADEAQRMADAARRNGRLLVEAFHYRFHPLLARAKEIVDSGEIGELRHVEADFCVPLWRFSDIRYSYKLGGGATMDLGCYCINLIRWMTGQEPEVVQARALTAGKDIDRYMKAEFQFPNNITARMSCSLWSRVLLKTRALIRGTRGEIRIPLPFQPHLLHKLKVSVNGKSRTESASPERSYVWQLRAFAAATRGEANTMPAPEDSIANLRVIDAVYKEAGLNRRGEKP